MINNSRYNSNQTTCLVRDSYLKKWILSLGSSEPMLFHGILIHAGQDSLGTLVS